MRNFISFHGPEKGIILVNELIREESTQRAEITRMHSSRMRTGRSLTVCRSLLPRGGCCLLGGCLPGEVSPGGVCLGGLLPGGYPSMQWGRPPPLNRITDACKNITLAQLRCGR